MSQFYCQGHFFNQTAWLSLRKETKAVWTPHVNYYPSMKYDPSFKAQNWTPQLRKHQLQIFTERYLSKKKRQCSRSFKYKGRFLEAPFRTNGNLDTIAKLAWAEKEALHTKECAFNYALCGFIACIYMHGMGNLPTNDWSKGSCSGQAEHGSFEKVCAIGNCLNTAGN